MIITEPSLRPSDRLIICLKEYFEDQGFSFNKGQKLFIRPFSRGYQIVSFWFRINSLTEVSLEWSIHFEKLEKLFAELNGTPKKYRSIRTIATNMSNYTRCGTHISFV